MKTKQNPQVELFFLDWARSTLHLLMKNIEDAGSSDGKKSGEMARIGFFLDSLEHHYLSERRTRALVQALTELKNYCGLYPEVTPEQSRKASFLTRYLYKALGLESALSFLGSAKKLPPGFIERRGEERYAFITPAWLHIAGVRKSPLTRIVDISRSGMRIECGREVREGSIFEIEFRLTDQPRPVIVAGRAHWARTPHRIATVSQCGVRLLSNVAPTARKKLESFIYDCLKDHEPAGFHTLAEER